MPSAALPSDPIPFSRVRKESAGATTDSPDDLPSGSVDVIGPMELYEPFKPQRIPANPSSPGKEENVKVPFIKLPGEYLRYYGRIHKGELYVTTFRLFVDFEGKRGFYNIPFTSVDIVEAKDLCVMQISCKDGRIFKITTEASDSAVAWYKLLTQLFSNVRQVEDIFAFAFKERYPSSIDPSLLRSLDVYRRENADNKSESCRSFYYSRRLGFDDRYWRISHVNRSYELCETYPRTLIVPQSITDEEIKIARDTRFLNRIPAVVWRNRDNSTVLLRSSQPKVGLFSWGYPSDERLIDQVLISVVKQAQAVKNGNNINRAQNGGETDDEQKLSCAKSMLIMDARSYAAAFANKAKGGGFESTEYYKKTELQFMGLPNIHNIRYSFQQFRLLICSPIDEATYFQSLQNTQWYLYLSNLMSSGLRVVEAMLDEGRSVLVHCSDGWDRTSQIVSLAKLIMDPYYRTITGFKELVEREWIDFGHKFSDRTGVLNLDANERSPVFLQWLECVYQLYVQFPFAFEFSQLYLAKLAQHSYAGLFGTFLANSNLEACGKHIHSHTFSVWQYLHPDNSLFKNFTYMPRVYNRLRPIITVQNMRLWREVYCSSHYEPVDIGSEEPIRTRTASTTETDRSLNRSHSCDSLSNIELGSSPPAHTQSVTTIMRTGSESNLIATAQQQQADDSMTTSRLLVDDMLEKVAENEDGHIELQNGKSTESFDLPDSSIPIEAIATAAADFASAAELNANYHIVRNCQGSSREMNTSTSEISDSVALRQPFNTLRKARESRRNRSNAKMKLRGHQHWEKLNDALDFDGLTKIDDPVQERIVEIQREHEVQVNALEIELQYYRRLFRDRPSSMAQCRKCSEISDVGESKTNSLKAQYLSFEPHSAESAGSEHSMDRMDDEMTNWIPDSAISHCMGCDTKFCAIIRKHHCRSCGKVFCSACSSNESSVPEELLYESVRICQQCSADMEREDGVLSGQTLIVQN